MLWFTFCFQLMAVIRIGQIGQHAALRVELGSSYAREHAPIPSRSLAGDSAKKNAPRKVGYAN